MSTPNAGGILAWNCDNASIGAITKMDVAYAYEANVTYDDTAAPTHSYTTTVQQTCSASGTNTAYRVAYPTALGTNEFRLYCGGDLASSRSVPLLAGEPTSGQVDGPRLPMTIGETNVPAFIWTTSVTTTLTETYAGPGAPPNTTTTTTETLQIYVEFSASYGSQHFYFQFSGVTPAIDVSDKDHDASGSVDPITLGGLPGFSFTNTNASGDGVPAGFVASAYSVYCSGSVTPS